MLTTTIFEAEVDLETSLMFRSARIAAAWNAFANSKSLTGNRARAIQTCAKCSSLSSTILHAAAIHFRLQLDEGSGVVAVAACLQFLCPETPFTPFSVSLSKLLGSFQ